ncbi:hypothetical protein PENSPDRAFT_756511 [Peniophora sp. CONT]|nr:hypothetical protein PENSPDRAFT_756511 [Peniophora sp. CONT]
MKRRSQGRTSIAKETSPAPQASSPANSKRGPPGDGDQRDAGDNPAKRQKTDPVPSTSTGNGDPTLIQEEKADVDAALSPLTANDEPDSHTSPKSMRSPSPDEPAPARHERFWYDDGSVVLQIRRVLFRLHKSLLSVQSSSLRDLFADPYRPAEKYDAGSGVLLPLYVLSFEGLRTFDFEQLLEVLENPYTHTRNMESPPLDKLNAIARAAHVLRFENTHAWAKDELLEYWPSGLDEITSQATDYSYDAMTALQVSVDADVPGIRKGAFYELLRLANFGQRDEDVPLLCHNDYNILTRARQYCAQTWLDIILTVPRRVNSCAEEEKKTGDVVCAARNSNSRTAKWHATVVSEDLRKYLIDPVAGFRALQTIDLPMEEKSGFCFDCRQAWKKGWQLKMRQFWDGLDEVLGLVPEKEAEKADETVEVVG